MTPHPGRVCSEPGCPVLVDGKATRCREHILKPERARNGSTRQWRRVRAAVLERDLHRCQLRFPGCAGRATEVDHRIAWSAGGPDHELNAQAACTWCNQQKGAKNDLRDAA